jgi:hypothetical protein
MSFLTINTMISMSVPSVAQTMQQALLNLVFFDIFFTEKWLPTLLLKLGLDPNFYEQPLN